MKAVIEVKKLGLRRGSLVLPQGPWVIERAWLKDLVLDTVGIMQGKPRQRSVERDPIIREKQIDLERFVEAVIQIVLKSGEQTH
jgi:hypothetical protein